MKKCLGINRKLHILANSSTRKPVETDARLKLIVLTLKAPTFRKSVVQETKNFEVKMRQDISDEDVEVWRRVTEQMTKI